MFSIELVKEDISDKSKFSLVVIHSSGIRHKFKDYGDNKPEGRTIIDDNKAARNFIDFVIETQRK